MNKFYNFKSKLVEKVQIAENDFRLKYQVPLDFSFKPGQFVGIRVIPTHTRAYSIVAIENGLLELLVDTKPGGIASQYFEKTQVGDEAQILGPYGIYGIKSDLPSKIFICTGTGVAPFIPMVRSLFIRSDLGMIQESHHQNVQIKMLFGTRTDSNDIAYGYFKDLPSDQFEYLQCVTREEPKNTYSIKGRVTEALSNMISNNTIDPVNTEFYICGGKEMIDDSVALIKNAGGDKIYFEKYG